MKVKTAIIFRQEPWAPRREDHPACPHCEPDGRVSAQSGCDEDLNTLEMETLGSSVTHAARLSQSDDWFVSLFPIVANVLIITRANDMISQSEAVIRPDLTNQRPGRGQPIYSCPAVVTW